MVDPLILPPERPAASRLLRTLNPSGRGFANSLPDQTEFNRTNSGSVLPAALVAGGAKGVADALAESISHCSTIKILQCLGAIVGSCPMSAVCAYAFSCYAAAMGARRLLRHPSETETNVSSDQCTGVSNALSLFSPADRANVAKRSSGKASLDQQSDRARQLNPPNSSSEPVPAPVAECFRNFVVTGLVSAGWGSALDAEVGAKLSVYECAGGLSADRYDRAAAGQDSDPVDGGPEVGGEHFGVVDVVGGDCSEGEFEDGSAVGAEILAGSFQQIVTEHQLKERGALSGEADVAMSQPPKLITRFATFRCLPELFEQAVEATGRNGGQERAQIGEVLQRRAVREPGTPRHATDRDGLQAIVFERLGGVLDQSRSLFSVPQR
jgi:hypothetical protein